MGAAAPPAPTVPASLLAKFANFVYFCITCGNYYHIWAENGIAISTRNTKIYKLCKATFSAFYDISQANFAILLILVCFSAVVIYLHLLA
jgi:hypothetical protein